MKRAAVGRAVVLYILGSVLAWPVLAFASDVSLIRTHQSATLGMRVGSRGPLLRARTMFSRPRRCGSRVSTGGSSLNPVLIRSTARLYV